MGYSDNISRQAVKELAHNQVREKYCGMAFKEQRDFYIKLADSIIDLLPPAQPDCAKCKSELANKIRGQQDNPGMLTEKDKGRNWGLEWAAQIVEGKRR